MSIKCEAEDAVFRWECGGSSRKDLIKEISNKIKQAKKQEQERIIKLIKKNKKLTQFWRTFLIKQIRGDKK